MWRAGVVLVCLVVLSPASASAQALNALADWTVGRALFKSDGTVNRNNGLTQTYTIGYRSSFLDPRFLQYLAELTFLRNGISLDEKKGHRSSTGFNLGANLFPARPFPFSIQWQRTTGGQSGDFPAAIPIIGGVPLPPGSVLPDVVTLDRALTLNSRIDTPSLPRVELGCHRGSSEITAGPIDAEQRDRVLTFSLLKDTARTHHALRFQRNAFQNLLSDAFTLRFSDLSYDLQTHINRKTRATVRAGRRSTYSLFQSQSAFTDIGQDTYRPPAEGEVTVEFVTGTLTYNLAQRLAADITAAYDREQSAGGRTNAALVTAGVRYQLLRPLTLTAATNYGVRGQRIGGNPLDVMTSSVRGGFLFSQSWKHLDFSAGADRGFGRHSELPQQGAATQTITAESRMWNAQGSIGTDGLKWVRLLASYERNRSEDTLLAFGNYRGERTRASARTASAGRASAEFTWERAYREQGLADTFSWSWTRTAAATLNIALARSGRLAFTGGQFVNQTRYGLDRTSFYGASFDAHYGRGLDVSLSARREQNEIEQTRLNQDGWVTLARLDYRLRLFTFGFEHRYTTLDLSMSPQARSYHFMGRQLLFRVSRRFGLTL